MRSAVRNDLFPSADMILCLSREFGIPMTTDDFMSNLPVSIFTLVNFYTAIQHISHDSV